MRLYVETFGFGVVQASMLALAALGFTLQFGITRILNIAYGPTMMISAFIAYVANLYGGSVVIAGLVAAVTGLVVSVLLNRLLIRPFGARVGTSQMVIVSLALSVILENILLAVAGPGLFSYKLAPPRIYRLGGLLVTQEQVVVVLITALAIILLHFTLRQTSLGRGMRAAAENWSLARASGVPVRRIEAITWALSGALCGLAGFVLAIDVGAFQPSTGDDFLIVVVAAAVLGGIGRPYGALVGALVIGLSTQFLALTVGSQYADGFALLIMIAVLALNRSSLTTTSGALQEAR